MTEAVNIKVSHVLTPELEQQLSASAYQAMVAGIERAIHDTKIENDLIFSKKALSEYLGISQNYLEQLLADENFPRGRTLSDRKQVFSKSDIRQYFLLKDKK